MRPYWECLKYIFWHKWYVYRECRALGLGFWQSAMHDMSKLSWLELRAYTTRFYKHDNSLKARYDFDNAWLHHIHCNPHHWQHFILQNDTEGVRVLRMPEKYVREMVADWRGVGMALGKGRENAVTWYEENRTTLALHPQTRNRVETLLGLRFDPTYFSVVEYPVPREPGT